jgi:hypothetical protein
MPARTLKSNALLLAQADGASLRIGKAATLAA